MKNKTLFIALFITTNFLLSCTKTSETITVDELASNLSKDSDFVNLREMEMILFTNFVNNTKNSPKESTPKRFLDNSGYSNSEDLLKHLSEQYLKSWGNIFFRIPELLSLNDKDLKSVFVKARKIYNNDNLRNRYVDPCIVCLQAAWDAYDDHTDWCISSYYSSTDRNLQQYSSCLTVAYNNFMFNSDNCCN